MKKVFFDMPHNYGDPGACGNGLQEKDCSATISQSAKSYLLSNYEGVEVKLLSDIAPIDGRKMELSQRASYANKWGADIFVSPHLNASADGKGNGFESYVYTNASQASVSLQNMVHPEILKTMKGFGQIADRGKKRANHAVTRLTNMPAILTENLFVTNAADAAKLKADGFLKAVGEAHARGIASFLGLKPKTQVKTAETGKKYRLRTGVFNSYEDAKKVADELTTKYGTLVYIDEE